MYRYVRYVLHKLNRYLCRSSANISFLHVVRALLRVLYVLTMWTCRSSGSTRDCGRTSQSLCHRGTRDEHTARWKKNKLLRHIYKMSHVCVSIHLGYFRSSHPPNNLWEESPLCIRHIIMQETRLKKCLQMTFQQSFLHTCLPQGWIMCSILEHCSSIPHKAASIFSENTHLPANAETSISRPGWLVILLRWPRASRLSVSPTTKLQRTVVVAIIFLLPTSMWHGCDAIVGDRSRCHSHLSASLIHNEMSGVWARKKMGQNTLNRPLPMSRISHISSAVVTSCHSQCWHQLAVIYSSIMRMRSSQVISKETVCSASNNECQMPLINERFSFLLTSTSARTGLMLCSRTSSQFP